MPKNKKRVILAIETSCDETAAAILVGDKILANIVYSQLKIHQKTKGIVPEAASRAHIEKIIPVIDRALCAAKIPPDKLDLIAVTVGPGLIGSLLIGVDTAKALGFVWHKKVMPINHVEGHIYANFGFKNGQAINSKSQAINFPVVCLIVSGGHTQLILMRGHGNYKLLGSTLDDAAGEAFDKVANILGLGYPGGPAIAAAAAKAKTNCKPKILLPRPLINSGDFNFSFSGLKTAVLYKFQNLKISKFKTVAMAAEFQRAAIEVLVTKTIAAAKKYQAKSIILGGGVAANKLLRQELKKTMRQNLPSTLLFLPPLSLCTDNAAMIGLCAYYHCLKSDRSLKDNQEIKVNLQMTL